MKLRTFIILLALSSLAALPACTRHDDDPRIAIEAQDSHNAFQAITGEDSDTERERWNAKYSTSTYVYGKQPDSFLRENVGLLPKGRALIYPMEEGRNAVFLAKKGLAVEGIDFSDVAIQKAKRLAKENGVYFETINADLTTYKIPPDTYDAIISMGFHRDRLINEIKKGLRKNGIVVYETYTTDQAKIAVGPESRHDNLLKPGQLREYFKDFDILVYQESNDGKRAVASLIARKKP